MSNPTLVATNVWQSNRKMEPPPKDRPEGSSRLKNNAFREMWHHACWVLSFDLQLWGKRTHGHRRRFGPNGFPYAHILGFMLILYLAKSLKEFMEPW